MVHVPVKDEDWQLKVIVRRIQAGEPVVLTRDGMPVARIDGVRPESTAEHRARAIEAAHAALQGVVFDETCAARSQDFLYDEDGLPA